MLMFRLPLNLALNAESFHSIPNEMSKPAYLLVVNALRNADELIRLDVGSDLKIIANFH